MQLNVTLKYSIMNKLLIKEKNCLNAKKAIYIILIKRLKRLK